MNIVKFVLDYIPQLDEDVPAIQQVYLAIKEAIETGLLKSGQELPAVRALSDVLTISEMTVSNAYQRLVNDGYILRRTRKPCIVAYTSPLDSAISQLLITAHRSNISKEKLIEMIIDKNSS